MVRGSLVIYASTPMPVTQVREVIARFGPILRQVDGMTEGVVATMLHAHRHPPRRPRPRRGVTLLLTCGAAHATGVTYPFTLASDFSRMASSVVVGVIALASTFTWMIDGLPDLSAASNALGKSAVFSTVAPKPPNARA